MAVQARRGAAQVAAVCLLALTWVVAGPTPAHALAPITVNTAADHDDGSCLPAPLGDCTLREAIAEANTVPGSDTVSFDLPSGTSRVITPATALPAIVDPTTIDATTQPGYAGTPLITLSGTAAPDTTNGLSITGGASTVSGLSITGFGGSGIALATAGGNVIRANVLGTAGAGNGTGVRISGGSSSNQIGGDQPGDGNVVAANAAAGIEVVSGTGNALLGNAVLDNGQLGIDLLPAGPSGNDPLDGDDGANGMQNAPRLIAGTRDGPDVFVAVELDSRASTVYRIELFASTVCDTPSYTGEGAALVGTTRVTTDAAGSATFTVALTADVPVGHVLTATATDPGGSSSELSSCTAVAAPPTASIGDTRALEAGSDIPVVLVGNSLMNSSTEELQATLTANHRFVPTIEAHIGTGLLNGTYDWPTKIGQLVSAKNPAEVVVELGTNDTLSLGSDGYRAAIDEVMARTRGVRQVWWLNVSERTAVPARNAGARRINADLAAAALRWPTLRIVDYDPEVTADHHNMDCLDGFTLCDSVHINYRGQQAYADMVAQSLGVGAASFTVTLSVPSGRPVTVRVRTSAGTATTPGDYRETQVDVTIPPGQLVKRFAVPLVDDARVEADQQFAADTTAVTGGSPGDTHGVATVLDNDVAPK